RRGCAPICLAPLGLARRCGEYFGLVFGAPACRAELGEILERAKRFADEARHHRDHRIARRGAIRRREPRITVDGARRQRRRERAPRLEIAARLCIEWPHARIAAARGAAAAQRTTARRIEHRALAELAAARRATLDRRPVPGEIEQRELDRAQRT